jgi:quercetin dioxygenase-like cupin family protein
MPAGTGAEPHSHPNEQWIYVVEGTLAANIDGKTIEARSGTVLYIPASTVHSIKST